MLLCKAVLGRGQSGVMRWSLVWIMPQRQDWWVDVWKESKRESESYINWEIGWPLNGTQKSILRETDRQMDRQIDTDRLTDRRTERQTDRQADRRTNTFTHTYTHTDRKKNHSEVWILPPMKLPCLHYDKHWSGVSLIKCMTDSERRMDTPDWFWETGLVLWKTTQANHWSKQLYLYCCKKISETYWRNSYTADIVVLYYYVVWEYSIYSISVSSLSVYPVIINTVS